ncbi:MAG: tripartite tricarboxylate transporter substrate binding protein [Xanthobacteraceae bacterium]
MLPRLLLLLPACVLLPSPATAQSWPARPIEMIIAFPAGGGVDAVGRSVASTLSRQLGQQVVVNNRDGASGTLGFNALATAAPNGYTIAFGPTTPVANAPYLVKGVRYQLNSFEYLCQVFENVFTIAVAPQSRFHSIEDLVAAARAQPGTISYGHAGPGTIPHLAVENLADALKVSFHAVPFRGDGPALPTLLKGDLDFVASAVSTIHGKEFRPLLLFWGERHPSYPDVPTARERGVLTDVPPGHNGLFAPKGLPSEIKTSLERECAAAVESPPVKQMILTTGQTIRYLGGGAFQAQTEADYRFKGELIHRLGLAVQ